MIKMEIRATSISLQSEERDKDRTRKNDYQKSSTIFNNNCARILIKTQNLIWNTSKINLQKLSPSKHAERSFVVKPAGANLVRKIINTFIIWKNEIIDRNI